MFYNPLLRQSAKVMLLIIFLCAKVQNRSAKVKSPSAEPTYPQVIHKSVTRGPKGTFVPFYANPDAAIVSAYYH